MRTTILLIFVIACALACKKSEPVQPGLFGKWEIRNRSGSIAGFDSTYKAGNGTIMQFNSDSTYKYYIKNKLTLSGTFHIRPFGALGEVTHIYFNGDTIGQPFSINGIEMNIGTSDDDGVVAHYVKVAN